MREAMEIQLQEILPVGEHGLNQCDKKLLKTNVFPCSKEIFAVTVRAVNTPTTFFNVFIKRLIIEPMLTLEYLNTEIVGSRGSKSLKQRFLNILKFIGKKTFADDEFWHQEIYRFYCIAGHISPEKVKIICNHHDSAILIQ